MHLGAPVDALASGTKLCSVRDIQAIEPACNLIWRLWRHWDRVPRACNECASPVDSTVPQNVAIPLCEVATGLAVVQVLNAPSHTCETHGHEHVQSSVIHELWRIKNRPVTQVIVRLKHEEVTGCDLQRSLALPRRIKDVVMLTEYWHISVAFAGLPHTTHNDFGNAGITTVGGQNER